MEAVKIKKFLSGSGSGYGDGSGYGYGDGSGYGSGSGYGYGDGSGYGYGDGYGYGSGDGYGYGYGSSYGYGDGSGSGYGDGSGSGDGSGYGYGDGSGSGYGDGSGSGDGSGLKIQNFKNSPVHYIDGIPCIFQSIKEEYALVEVINVGDFGTKQMYVAKQHGFFAHGITLKEAIEEAEQKWINSQTVEEKVAQFKEKFKKGVSYPAALFYEWHSLLTGSCKAGKDLWVSQNRIDLNSNITVEKFVQLTKNDYGSEVIKRLTD